MTAEILPAHWKHRPDTWDAKMFDAVVVNNEYKLAGGFVQDDVILDVGAHIGCFSWMCLQRGAGLVIAAEADAENHLLLSENLAPCRPHAMTLQYAVWRSDRPRETLGFRHCANRINTGGGAVTAEVEEVDGVVTTIGLDSLIRMAGTWGIRLLKIDCEGSEFPILYTSQLLGRVQEICGEYHAGFPQQEDLPPSTIEALSEHLSELGFAVKHRATAERLGLFWATR